MPDLPLPAPADWPPADWPPADWPPAEGHDAATPDPAPAPAELRTIRSVLWGLFLLNGVLLSSWATEIPAVQQRWSLDAAGTGGLLFTVMLGNTLVLPLVPRLQRALGMRRLLVLALVLMCVTLAAVPLIPSLAGTALMLLLFGAAFSVSDLTLNTGAALLEQQLSRPVMSGLHGAYSVGTLIGAGLGGLLLGLGTGTAAHLLGVCLLLLPVGALLGRQLRPGWADLPAPDPQDKQAQNAAGTGGVGATLRRLPWAVTGLLILGFVAAVSEGAIGDWAAVYLRDTLGALPGAATLGFFGFALAMVAGRLTGDRLTTRFGARRLGTVASTLMGTGFLILVLARALPWGVAGFTLSGLGLSVLTPLLFSAAGASPFRAALPLLTAVFYGGFLLAPVLVAGLAHLTSLRLAFLLPLALSLLFTLLVGGGRLLPGRTDTA